MVAIPVARGKRQNNQSMVIADTSPIAKKPIMLVRARAFVVMPASPRLASLRDSLYTR